MEINEIVRALKICSNHNTVCGTNFNPCNCPYNIYAGNGCDEKLMQDAAIAIENLMDKELII